VAETNPVCFTAEVDEELLHTPPDAARSLSGQRSPPPQYPASEAPGTSAFRPPPSFSSLFPPQDDRAVPESVLEPCEPYKHAVEDTASDEAASPSADAPAYAPPPDQVASESSNSASAALQFQDETKRALPRDTKGHAGSSKDDDAEPPPAYSEGSSPLHTFTYLMAAAGGAASIITQVQQGGPSLNPLGGR
jgi:G patch domain-containing protein 1